MPESMLEYKGYHAKIYFDARDEIFVGEVFGLNDSLNFHGNTVQELKEMFRQCIDNYLQLCQELGEEPEREFKGNFNIRVQPELHRQLAYNALKEGKSLNQYINDSLEQFIANSATVPAQPQAPAEMDAERMSAEQLREKLQKGYDEIEAGRFQVAETVFAQRRK